MSDDLVRRAAALVEKQKAWDAWDNPSQPAPPAMVEGEVATLVSDMAAEITRLRAELATARREVEQERDELFNRLGRITDYLDIPVDATAQRIIEAIQERVDNEREACASVEVRLTVPEGAESWTPLEAWEEALIAFDEAFRDAIRAPAQEGKP